LAIAYSSKRSHSRQQNEQNSKTHKWQGLQPKVTFHENRLDKINIALTCQELSLVKRLQKSLTTVEIPWTPPNNSRCSRLLNEIVLAEESDLNINGDPQSHLEMYLEAMDEIGADSKVFRAFLELVQNGEDVNKSLRLVNIPSYIVEFVEYTMKISLEGSLAEVMGCFFFGREDIVPRMFQNFLDRCKIDLSEAPFCICSWTYISAK